jgi:hypothetical protein
MIFSDLKESIKACDSDNCIINDFFFLLHLFELFWRNNFIEFCKNFRELNIIIFFRQLREIHDKRCNQKIEVTRDEDHTQELNPKQSVSALIPIEK